MDIIIIIIIIIIINGCYTPFVISVMKGNFGFKNGNLPNTDCKKFVKKLSKFSKLSI